MTRIRRAGAAMTLGLLAAAAHGQGAPGVPAVVSERGEALVMRCVNAGGSLGSLRGQGQFIRPADFNGDGRMDFLVSEGNVPCVGQPDLFRQDGQARVQLFLGDDKGGARLVFDESLVAYRLLDGRPPRLQIARQGAACGATAGPCGDELRWNPGTGRFDVVPTDGRAAPVAAASASAPAGAPSGAGGSPVLPSPIPDAQARFRAQCMQDHQAQSGGRTLPWMADACAEDWKKVVAAGPVVGALFAALPDAAGPPPALAAVRQRLAAVRWAARPKGQLLASGQLGAYEAAISGKAGRPEAFWVGWQQVGAEIPLDVPAAFAARGASLTLTRCEKLGAGEGERVWLVALPGRAPFMLRVFQRTAPTGNAWSSYAAEVPLDGRPAERGPTGCERFW